MIRVGPQSAGADPGPAAYGRGGTDATVTDAQRRARAAASRGVPRRAMQLDATWPSARWRNVAEPLGLPLEDAALGVIAVTVHNMVNAIETNSVRKGYDPRDFVPGRLRRRRAAARGRDRAHYRDPARGRAAPPGRHRRGGPARLRRPYELRGQCLAGSRRRPDPTRWRRSTQSSRPRSAEHLAGAGFEGRSGAIQRWPTAATTGQAYELLVDRSRPDALDAGWARRVARGVRGPPRARVLRPLPRGAPVQIVTLRVYGIGLMPALRWPDARAAAEAPDARRSSTGAGRVRDRRREPQRTDTPFYDRERLLRRRRVRRPGGDRAARLDHRGPAGQRARACSTRSATS